MSIDLRQLVRLEVEEAPDSWLDILGPSAGITVDRDELNVGSMSVRVFDANLDPSKTDLIRQGRRVRLLTVHGDQIFGGTVLTGSVTYHLLAKEERKRAEVNLTAVDPATPLASAPRPEGVATIPELAYVLAGTGVPFTLNGEAGTDDAEVVSYNENASALDQVALTRDSRLGYAWVDRRGFLRVWDRDLISSRVAKVLDESDYRADLNLDLDLDRLINSVTVKVLAVVATSGAIEEIAFGPYVDADSIASYGEHRAEYTVHGFDADDEPAIAAYADQILAANAQPRLRANSLTLPIRSNDDLPKALLDLYDLVTVVNSVATLDQDSRIVTISHSITPDKNTHSGVKWLMTVGFVADGSVAPATAPPSAPAIVRDVLEDVNAGVTLALQDAYDYADQKAAGLFTDPQVVQTSFQLGDSDSNGAIASYNFSDSEVGVYMDKEGLVAKGGTIAGAEIIGGVVDGAIVRTGEAGQRVELVDAATAHGSVSSVELYTGYEPSPGVESEPAVLRAAYTDSAGVTETATLSGPPGDNVVGPNVRLETNLATGVQASELYAIGEVTLTAEGTHGKIYLYAPAHGVDLTGALVLEDLATGAPGDTASGARFARVGDDGRLFASTDLPASLQSVLDDFEARLAALEGP